MDNLGRLPPAHCTKIFVQRDYSDGTAVKFQAKFPQELEGKESSTQKLREAMRNYFGSSFSKLKATIERRLFETTINELNVLYAEAESLCARTYCENCLACLTAYIILLCMDTHYEKVLKKISRYISDQNNSVYAPHGLLLVDPVERGLRVLEICILSENQSR